jgi:hypothetical protein
MATSLESFSAVCECVCVLDTLIIWIFSAEWLLFVNYIVPEISDIFYPNFNGL